MKVFLSIFLSLFIFSCSTKKKVYEKIPEYKYIGMKGVQDDVMLAERLWSEKFFLTGVNATRYTNEDIKQIMAIKDKNARLEMLKRKYFYQFKNKLKGMVGTYQVRYNGETPRMIAYKLYADTKKYKDLMRLNPEITNKLQKLKKGEILYYLIPRKSMVWTPEGIPYEIRKYYSVSNVSEDIYKSIKKWIDVYRENALLLGDGDLDIFKKIKRLEEGKVSKSEYEKYLNEGDILYWYPSWFNEIDSTQRNLIKRIPMSSTEVEFFYLKDAKQGGLKKRRDINHKIEFDEFH